MSFGLTNASTYFVNLMNKVLLETCSQVLRVKNKAT
jgi:hypothetical protein